jgi:hypothetical protein
VHQEQRVLFLIESAPQRFVCTQQPDEEDGAALSGALCALAEAHMHAADVEQAGPGVEALLREAVQLAASPEPLQVQLWMERCCGQRVLTLSTCLCALLDQFALQAGAALCVCSRQTSQFLLLSPGQALASLRVEQGRPDEALAALQQSMALWYVPHPDSTQGKEAAAANTADAAKSGAKQGASGKQRASLTADELPSYEFRLETVKLLLELEDTIETAAEVHSPCREDKRRCTLLPPAPCYHRIASQTLVC